MGQAKKKRERFFQEHPMCCFCGGTTIATTIDHLPQRGHFFDRIWPEGYEFPACESCQASTANLEQLVAFVAKFSTVQMPDAERLEFRERARAVKNNFPTIFDELFHSAAAAKRIVRERNIRLPEGMLASEAPLVNLNHPELQHAVWSYARKLTLALHYMHTSSILPIGGAILCSWYTNVHKMEGRVPVDLISDLKGVPTVQRQMIPLIDQFNYRFGVERSTRTSVIFVTLGDSLSFLSVSTPDPTRLDIPADATVLRPFPGSQG